MRQGLNLGICRRDLRMTMYKVFLPDGLGEGNSKAGYRDNERIQQGIAEISEQSVNKRGDQTYPREEVGGI